MQKENDNFSTNVTEKVSVVHENDPLASPKVARLIPVPGSNSSFYLSYDGTIKTDDPVYQFPSTSKPKHDVQMTTKKLKQCGNIKNYTTKLSENMKAASVGIYTNKEQNLLDMEPAGDFQVCVENSTPRRENVSPEMEETEDIFEDTDLYETDGIENDDIEYGEEDEDELSGKLSDNLKAKIDEVSKCNNLKVPYRFSGKWKKPPKEEELMKARFAVLQQIYEDYQKVCKICFNGEHDIDNDCPLLNPDVVVENDENQMLRYGMPQEIVFGTSRVFPGVDSLFARDEIAAFTQFGPLTGKIVTMQDLAAMGVVRNELDVSNLWPLPIENGQHEFDFQYFINTANLEESNWLKFIKIESSNEEHPPYNIQTIYRDSNVYFVTTKEIEPGGELFLRPFEPPNRVYYNMHRLGEVYYNFCSRAKCKPSADEHLHLSNLTAFVRHQFLTHASEVSVFSWAAIYNCTLCAEDCFDKENYEYHMKEKHDVANIKQAPNACRFCGLVLKTKNYMYKHIEIHHGRGDRHDVPCPYCAKIFKHSQYLKSHIKGAHTEQPEACPVCKKICKNRYRMRAHLKKVHKTNIGEVQQIVLQTGLLND